MLTNKYFQNTNISSLKIGVLEAYSLKVESSPPELIEKINSCTSLLLPIQEDHQSKIRDLLRNGKYKPTGRGKPAWEYLYQSVMDRKTFPIINNLVDINNFISLKYQLPISIFDLDQCEGPFEIRLGKPGENYIFNKSGQNIELEDLLLVADSKRPLGNPVKDRMETKVFEKTKNIFSVVYSSSEVYQKEELSKILNEFKELITNFAQKQETTTEIL